MLNDKELTSKKFWDERHQQHEPLKNVYPRPEKYYLDYELCLVLQKYLSKMKNKKILEIGCGSSIWLPYFYKKFGMDITGIDYSEKGIEISSKILNSNNAKGLLLKTNFLEIDEKYKYTFDVAFSLGVLEHFKDPLSVLKTFKDFLNPNGVLITWVPNTSGLAINFSQHLNKSLKNFYYNMDINKLIEFHRLSKLEVLEGYYTQFMDLKLVNLLRLPKFLQKCFYSLFGMLNILFILLGRYFNVHFRIGKLCSGIIVVARRKDFPHMQDELNS